MTPDSGRGRGRGRDLDAIWDDFYDLLPRFEYLEALARVNEVSAEQRDELAGLIVEARSFRPDFEAQRALLGDDVRSSETLYACNKLVNALESWADMCDYWTT